MKTIKLSPSRIDNFVRYLNPNLEYDTLERLLEKLTGSWVPNEAVFRGTAGHHIIEKPGKYKNPDGSYDIPIKDVDYPIHMTAQEAKSFEDFAAAHPNCAHEMYGEKMYRVSDSYQVKLRYFIDMLDVDLVHDHKTKNSTPKAEEYFESYQWRYYLDASELHRFQYNFFQYMGRKGDKYYKLHEPLKLYSYPGMEKDCIQMMEAFIDFLDQQGLLSDYIID